MTHDSVPALGCISSGHLNVVMVNAQTDQILGSWCIWCGTAAYDGDYFDATGRPTCPVRAEAQPTQWRGREET